MGNRDINWPSVWEQMKAALKRNGAPEEVVDAVDDTAWMVRGENFFFFCPRILYQWIEVPTREGEDSNIQYVKPILWPAIQSLGCKKLIYKFV